MVLATKPEPTPSDLEKSLTLYVTETDPSPVEKRSLARWILLAGVVLVLHFLAFYLSPGWYRPGTPPPVEVQQIDAAKLEAIKRGWKQRALLLAKDKKPEKSEPEPKNARYESDRNRTVEKETQAQQTNVIPNVAGDPKAQQEKNGRKNNQKAAPSERQIPLSNLSNLGVLVPAPLPEEQMQQQRGGPGDTGDQALIRENAPPGAENMLNTVESVYYSFFARLESQIGPVWQSLVRSRLERKMPPAGDYLTQAVVIFDAEGNYVTTQIHSSSGIEDFDSAIAASFRKIPRIPNPPRGLIQSDGRIHLGWSFNVRIGQDRQWQYLPPRREF